MKTAEDLLSLLGVQNCTQRHIDIVNDFIKSGEKDARKLLDKLGSWDAEDLATAERWLESAIINPDIENLETLITDAEKETTEIICVLDRSTSIRTSGLVEKTIEGFNSFLDEQKKLPGIAKLTLCLFDGSMTSNEGTYDIVHAGIDIKDVPELNENTFVPKGMTGMYDAIGVTIDNVATRIAKSDEKPKVVFLIMTDGEENASHEYNQKTVFELIKKYQTEHNWAFVFIGANIDTMQAGSGMGVSTGNTLSYTGTDHGVKTAYSNMSKSVVKMRSMSSSSDDFKDQLGNLMDNGEEKEKI